MGLRFARWDGRRRGKGRVLGVLRVNGVVFWVSFIMGGLVVFRGYMIRELSFPGKDLLFRGLFLL